MGASNSDILFFGIVPKLFSLTNSLILIFVDSFLINRYAKALLSAWLTTEKNIQRTLIQGLFPNRLDVYNDAYKKVCIAISP